MASLICPLCYNLNPVRHRKLAEDSCSYGQQARHWMKAAELRASARGTGGTRHSGTYRAFKRPCDKCGLLRDAVETFLHESGLAAQRCASREECGAVKYLVAVDEPEEGADDEDDDDEGAGSFDGEEISDEDDTDGYTDTSDDDARSGSAQGGSDGDWADSDDEEESGAGGANAPAAAARALETLRLVVKCNLDPPKTKGEYESFEELGIEVFAAVGGNIPPSFSWLKSAGEVPVNPSLQEYASTITAWVRECGEHHHNCNTIARAGVPKPLPRRVLDLAENKIVLIETGYKEGVYVALSHCWGKEQMLVTTRGTIDDRMKGISLDDMPRTFRDAVQLTRALNLRYIWIDSLCIIQDDIDGKDWVEQSAAMADIYANCHLNIATTRSPNGAEGFVHPRWTSRNSLEYAERFAAEVGSVIDDNDDDDDDDEGGARSKGEEHISKIRKCDVKSFVVSNRDNAQLYGSSIKVRLTLNSSHEAMQTFRWINSHQETAPLIQRGWVFQERHLSPRTVHFHANEMMWDCIDKQRCECLALDDREIGGDGWSASKSRISTLGTLEDWQLRGLWRTVVEDYCLLNLTVETDRLPALGGLAQKFSKHMPEIGGVKDEYMAGMWRNSLARDLLWKVKSQPKENSRKRPGKGPPSWSWVSLQHGGERSGIDWEWETKPRLVSWSEIFTYKPDKRFSILEASCELEHKEAPFGRILGGRIVAKGAMCAVSVSEKKKKKKKKTSAGGLPPWASRLPIRTESALNTLHLNFDDKGDAEEAADAGGPTGGFVFCLFVGTLFSHFNHGAKSTHAEHRGLILKPSATAPGIAERIGSWTQYIQHYTEEKDLFTKTAPMVVVTIV
ncbi:heterokaryon incompatibility protein-domain-containing protein [Durotheca rogersii]|uniref:heterokaryon incompatibility protein-domain-containing protein n=1 Tax=Durotheca rogersii TaxID=419775 RepID=UPI00221FF902|nr:heterokaryon incompatibility protein-domain-containing protein [Durotheca rogersii]KAI5865699.1 heterokaryon incompatibility protein-domain-containing protein [Durotheca rogersii]